LIYNASCADILMTDFAVAHRPFGQADIEAAGGDERRRIVLHERVIDRCVGEQDGIGFVPLVRGVFSPAVTDDQNNGFGHRPAS